MAERKATKKAAPKTKKAATKAAPKTKKAVAKKAPKTKKAAAKKAPKAEAAKAPKTKASKTAEAPKAKASKPAGGAISSKAVNLGNIFALRPRVNTSFRQEDFLAAKRDLSEEGYETIDAAARAVAEKALGASNDPKAKRGKKRGGR